MNSLFSRLFLFLRQQPMWVLVIFFLCVIAGSAARYFGLFNLGYVFDTITTQHAWGRNTYEMGFYGFWQNYTGFFDYLPGSLLWLNLFYAISRIPFIQAAGDWQSFVMVMKGFYWLVEIALSVIVFVTARKVRPTQPGFALIVAGLTYLNPSLWFVSGIWGQMDGLIATLSILVLFLLFASSAQNLPWYRTNTWFAGILWGITIWTKMQAILLLPIILLFFFWNKNLRQILFTSWYALPSVLIGLFIANPFPSPLSFSMPVQIWGSITAILLYLIINFSFKNNTIWAEVNRFFLGFWAVSAIVVANTIFFNATRLGSSVGAMFSRKMVVSEGAASAYGIFNLSAEGGGQALTSTLLIDAGTWTFSIGQFATICLVLAMATIAYGLLSGQDLRNVITSKIPILKSFSISEALLTLFMLNLAYFIFSTKMHSRYVHIGITLIPFLLIFSSTWKYKPVLFLSLILLNFSYLANQFSVMGAQYNDSIFYRQPQWLYTFMDSLKFDLNQIATVGNLIATIVLLGWYVARNKEIKSA